ncbi:MAG: L-seryl-tRNA(Sec) selenium transferase [Chloroflexi bacterium RBG_13_48_10]|nr:MAG: L-seryl-tRNA(Sec) selenium transferase [Chloroflexi bacterium RBG_13_48_10]
MSSLRDLPSVDQLLQSPVVSGWITEYGRPLTLEALRWSMDEARDGYRESDVLPSHDDLMKHAHDMLQKWASPSLQSVINASGVILHTNLGRAPLSTSAIQALQDVSLGYSNLEYDLQAGQRGSRQVHAESLLIHLTHAEAALVVNNNAAAVLLVLSVFARRRAVVISRSQLVEIGGGFRIPDVMKQSGARLCEVGTTNRVHPSDYQTAITDAAPALILHAHRSNFRITGFTSEPTLSELAEIAHQAGIPLVDDLGSGALLDTAMFGLGHEPMVSESISSGADLVCFSGDKLLGGPQAGIIIGKADLVAKLKKHPLARAIRADKLCLAALSATLLHYLKDEATTKIPIWWMISQTPSSLRLRAETWAKTLGMGDVIASQSTVGGGSLPDETLPTFVLALSPPSPNRILSHLRTCQPPVIARLETDRVIFDPRTILPDQESDLLLAIRSTLNSY